MTGGTEENIPMVNLFKPRFYSNVDASNVELESLDVTTSLSRVKIRVFTLCVLSGLAVSALLYNPKTALGLRFDQKDHFSGDSGSYGGITAVVSNEYTHIGYDMFPYPFLDQALLMEPYRENTVMMKGLPSDPSCAHTWRLEGPHANTTGSFNGAQYIVVPGSTGNYQLVVISNDIHRKNARSIWTRDVVVKYVRRDILLLTDGDREEFLDAFRTLWDVSTEEGKVLYGESYKSIYYFASIHNDAGANPVCDQFHGDVGFVHNHLYLSAFLEQSLQLVNPRTALHYWEYTRTFDLNISDLSSHVKNQLDGGKWTPLMTSKWFGSVDPQSGEILDGRWAHTSIPRVDQDFYQSQGVGKNYYFFPDNKDAWMELSPAHISSAFGLLRAPWNFSPSNFTLRFNNIARIENAENMTCWTFRTYMGSTCKTVKDLIKNDAVGQPLSTFLASVDGPAHGSIHYTLGGVGGQHAVDVDVILREEFGFTNDDIATISFASSNFMKTWLSGSSMGGAVNPLNCTAYPWDVDTETLTTNEPVKCMANEYFLINDKRANALLDLIFDGVTNDGTESNAYDLIKYNFTFPRKKEILRLISSRVQHDGDMAQSSSAVDPFFWVAHGAVERIYQRVLFENVLSDSVYKTQDEDNTCQGHISNGTAHYLKGFKFANEDIEPSNLTNSELLSLLDPTADAYADLFSFVYDNSQYQWCGSDEKVAEWFA